MMRPNANIAMDAILIGVAFLTIGTSLQRHFLFVNSASVAQQTSADTKSTTSNDYAQTLSTTTDRYPKLYAENDSYGKQKYRTKQNTFTFSDQINRIDAYRLAVTRNTLTALDDYYCCLRT